MKVLVGFEAILQQANRTIDPLNDRLLKDCDRHARRHLPSRSTLMPQPVHATSSTTAFDHAQASSEQRAIVDDIDDVRSLLDPSGPPSSFPG